MSNIFERDYQMLELDRDAGWRDARESYRRLVNRWHPDRFAARPRERHHAQSRFILPLQKASDADVVKNTQSTTKPSSSKTNKPTTHQSVELNDNGFAVAPTKQRSALSRYWLWAIPVIGLVLTFSVFIMLERRIAERQRDAAISVLRNTEPSKFLPDKENIRRRAKHDSIFNDN